MASETPVSDHPSQEEVEKEVGKKMEQEADVSVAKDTTAVATPCPAATVSDPIVKENDDDEKPKAEETAQVVAPLAEEKIGNEPIVPPPAEVLKKAEAVEEKPAEQPLAETVPALEKLEDKPVEAAAPADQLHKETELVAEEKIRGIKTGEPEDKTTADVPVEVAPTDKGIQEVSKGTDLTAAISEATIDDGKSDKKSEPDQPVGEPKAELIQETPQELAKESGHEPVEELKHESVEGKPQEKEKIEAKPVEEKGQELPPKAMELIEPKDVTFSEAACKPEEASAPVALAVEATSPEVVKQTDEEKQPPEQEVHENVNLSKEDETAVAEGSDHVKLETPGTQADEKALPQKASEAIGEGNEPTDTDEGKKVEVEAETKTLEVKPEEKSVVAQELGHSKQKPTEGVTSLAPPPDQPVEKPEATSRDIEPVVLDNGNKKETSADQTAKDVKIESVEATGAKPEDEKQVDEPAKTDIKDSECNKDSKETKTTQDKDKGSDVLTKPPKSSIVKMVKQSLVKAKKAIIGKSTNSSKTQASETKDQGNK